MTNQKEEFGFQFELPVYWLNPAKHQYDSDVAKMLRKGKPLEQTYHIIKREIEEYEVYTIVDKKGELTYWLVKHEFLSGSNSKGNQCVVRIHPIELVDIEKEHPNKKGYVILKGNYKKL